jgi:hypothetical protein
MNFMRVMMPRAVSSRTGALPTFWSKLLLVVAIGKAAVGGAGGALAFAGALNIAGAVTAQHWLRDLDRHYLDYFAYTGGVAGALIATGFRIFAR